MLLLGACDCEDIQTFAIAVEVYVPGIVPVKVVYFFVVYNLSQHVFQADDIIVSLLGIKTQYELPVIWIRINRNRIVELIFRYSRTRRNATYIKVCGGRGTAFCISDGDRIQAGLCN